MMPLHVVQPVYHLSFSLECLLPEQMFVGGSCTLDIEIQLRLPLKKWLNTLSYPTSHEVSHPGLVTISEKTRKTKGMSFSTQEAIEGTSALNRAGAGPAPWAGGRLHSHAAAPGRVPGTGTTEDVQFH